MTDPTSEATIRFALDTVALIIAVMPGAPIVVATWSHPASETANKVEIWVDGTGALVIAHSTNRRCPRASWKVPYAMDRPAWRSEFAKRLEGRAALAVCALGGKPVST